MNKKNLADILSENKIKSTKQRRVILSVISELKYPDTAEHIYLLAKKEDDSISLSTVYRALEIFTEKGIVNKNEFSLSDKKMYEINTKVHKHYLTCNSCKKILTVEGCPLEEYEKKLSLQTGFEITEHHLNLSGYCPKCRLENS